MHSTREEKSTTISRREWFERSDSMKGKDISTKPYTTQTVFFDTFAIDEESKQ
jgi:hypothetical protein